MRGIDLQNNVLPKLLENLRAAAPREFPPNFVGVAHGELQTKKNAGHAFLLHCLGATPAELRAFQDTQNTQRKGKRAGAWETMALMVEREMGLAGSDGELAEDAAPPQFEDAVTAVAQLRKQLQDSASELERMRVQSAKATKQSTEREDKARAAQVGLKKRLKEQGGELTQKNAQLKTQTNEINELKRKLVAFESEQGANEQRRAKKVGSESEGEKKAEKKKKKKKKKKKEKKSKKKREAGESGSEGESGADETAGDRKRKKMDKKTKKEKKSKKKPETPESGAEGGSGEDEAATERKRKKQVKKTKKKNSEEAKKKMKRPVDAGAKKKTLAGELAELTRLEEYEQRKNALAAQIAENAQKEIDQRKSGLILKLHMESLELERNR